MESILESFVDFLFAFFGDTEVELRTVVHHVNHAILDQFAHDAVNLDFVYLAEEGKEFLFVNDMGIIFLLGELFVEHFGDFVHSDDIINAGVALEGGEEGVQNGRDAGEVTGVCFAHGYDCSCLLVAVKWLIAANRKFNHLVSDRQALVLVEEAEFAFKVAFL